MVLDPKGNAFAAYGNVLHDNLKPSTVKAGESSIDTNNVLGGWAELSGTTRRPLKTSEQGSARVFFARVHVPYLVRWSVFFKQRSSRQLCHNRVQRSGQGEFVQTATSTHGIALCTTGTIIRSTLRLTTIRPHWPRTRRRKQRLDNVQAVSEHTTVCSLRFSLRVLTLCRLLTVVSPSEASEDHDHQLCTGTIVCGKGRHQSL